MFSKILLSHHYCLTIGQDDLLFLVLNVTHTDFMGLYIIAFLKLKHTSNIHMIDHDILYIYIYKGLYLFTISPQNLTLS